MSEDTMFLRGRDRYQLSSTAGEKSPCAKLLDCQARGIVLQLRAGVPRESLAALFGVSETTIYSVGTGRAYAAATREVRR